MVTILIKDDVETSVDNDDIDVDDDEQDRAILLR